ncbi:MAG: chloride channel protein [Lentisphaerota bacterium]
MMKFLAKSSDRARETALTIGCALAGAVAAVLFLKGTTILFNLLFVRMAGLSKVAFALYSLGVVMGSSLLVGLLLSRLVPEAAGSGIPQVKVAFWKNLGYIAWRPVWVKFIAGIISLGGGASLGREGPTVFISAGVASQLSGQAGTLKQKRRPAVAVGAAAGLAAAFNTPLAAVTFVLEEILGDMNSRILGRVVLASLTGAFTVYALIGKQPAFAVPDVAYARWPLYALVPLVALLAGIIGIVFQRATLSLRARIKQRSAIPAWLQPCVGGLITWGLGITVFLTTGRLGVFGLGYQDLSDSLLHGIPWHVALLLLAAKLPATIASYSWGGCGGIFSPTLFMGAMSGLALGGIAGQWIPLTPSDHLLLAATGMSACFSAVVRAPMTSLLIVFEMTHQFAMVPPLMLGLMVTQTIVRFAGKANFYDALLAQDGHEIHKVKPHRDLESWQNQPVSEIATMKPVILPDLSEETLRRTLQQHPFNRFPVKLDDQPPAILTRKEAETALKEKRPPQLEPAVTVTPDAHVRDVSQDFIKTQNGMLLIQTAGANSIEGLITLHDLLRAQVAQSE